MKPTEYRVVRDNFAGYEVQAKWRFWPFWTQLSINTHCSMDNAEMYIATYLHPELGRYDAEGHRVSRK